MFMKQNRYLIYDFFYNHFGLIITKKQYKILYNKISFYFRIYHHLKPHIYDVDLSFDGYFLFLVINTNTYFSLPKRLYSDIYDLYLRGRYV